MSLKQTVSEEFLAERPVLAAAFTPLSVVAGVAVGGVAAGMSLTNILICALVAGGGVALFCALAAWLFDAPMRPGLPGLWDESGQLRPLRFRRSRHPGRLPLTPRRGRAPLRGVRSVGHDVIGRAPVPPSR